MCEAWAEGDTVVCALLTLRVVFFSYDGISEYCLPRKRRGPRLSSIFVSPSDKRINAILPQSYTPVGIVLGLVVSLFGASHV
jgi:hypothetical protein